MSAPLVRVEHRQDRNCLRILLTTKETNSRENEDLRVFLHDRLLVKMALRWFDRPDQVRIIHRNE
jgi:hypothetical protein